MIEPDKGFNMKRVLVIENDPFILDLLIYILDELGIRRRTRRIWKRGIRESFERRLRRDSTRYS